MKTRSDWGISIPKCLSNYRDFGPSIDFEIKLKIYLEAKCSDHDMELSKINFIELVLIPGLIEVKLLSQNATACDCLGCFLFLHRNNMGEARQALRDKFLYLYNCFSQKNGTIFYYVLLISHKGLLSASFETLMVIIAWLEIWKI